MSITEIPKQYVYECESPRCVAGVDSRGVRRHVQRNASGHYPNSCPPGWWRVVIKTDRDAGCETLLCPACVAGHTGFLNAVRVPGKKAS